MKHLFFYIVFFIIIFVSCDSNTPVNSNTDNVSGKNHIIVETGNKTDNGLMYSDFFYSDNFYKPINKDCPIYIIPANKNSNVYAYFFINDKSDKTSLIPIFSDDNGNLFHEECKFKINYIDLQNNDKITVNYTETKKKLFFKSKKEYNHTFTKNISNNNFVKNRYKNEVFDSYKLIDDIKYGTAVGYWTNYSTEGDNDNYIDIVKSQAKHLVKSQKKLDLYMDIYYPENDFVEKRPLIMMIHGGGFFIGDKKNSFMQDMCPYLAKCGYTVASIDYRLGYIPSQANIDRIGYQALQDARAAMRYLVKNANKYNIDTARIYVAGTSAGAITGLNMAFMEEEFIPESVKGGFLRSPLGGLDDSGNKHKESFKVKAVINMWGAVHDSAMISPNKDIAILSVHGDADMVVPYEHANPFLDAGKIAEWLTNKLCGSKVIHRRAKENKYSSEKLIPIQGGGHGPIYDEKNQLNDNYYMIKDEMTSFLYNLNNKDLNEITIDDLNVNFEDNIIKINPTHESIHSYYINVVGGCITQDKKNNYNTTWFSNVNDRFYEFHITNKIGACKTLKLYVN
ncbi:MAG: alpha/beta hydrolase fold domain-containing protein [Bacteroidales bacterium]|jgi:predicted peptidase|nr:alpha/beta hydrolase fold domain-containing protein [Bacteroidales bacterium]